MRFLVTAGNTREKIDAVRDWGNVFTGNTGYSIARSIASAGEVDLLTSNRVHLAELESRQTTPHPIRGFAFTSHAELKSLLGEQMQSTSYDAIFMSAAVADYRPLSVFAVESREEFVSEPGKERWIVRDVQSGKVKSSFPAIAILGEQTEKLVDLFRKAWNYKGLLVKFKLEVGISRNELIRIGQESRAASGADYLVANTLEMIDGPGAGAYLLSDAGAEWIERGNLPRRMFELVSHNKAVTSIQ